MQPVRDRRMDGDGDGFVDCFDGAYIDDNNCVCATTADTDEGGIVDLFEDCTDADGLTCTPNNLRCRDCMAAVAHWLW